MRRQGEHQALISAAAQEYAAFLSKFESKKTTDDCFTPPAIFAAVHRWVVEEYGLHDRRVVRPFHPGGDFVSFDYRSGDVVLDNPPFSILTKIRSFYDERHIDYFLFAPTLTLFNINAPTMLVVGENIEYENGAKINTSFITNLQPGIRLRTAPALVQSLRDARPMRKTPAKYVYPPQVRNAAQMSRIACVDFHVETSECEFIAAMDQQRLARKRVFGGGFLLSDRAAAELKAAELKAAELKAAEQHVAVEAIEWELSEREREIIGRLNEGSACTDVAQSLFLFDEAIRND